MLVLGPLGFAAPWILLGLAGLPILWLVLRAVPPAPVRRRFPGVALLLGLADEEIETDRTPWWLLVLRSLAIAALIIAFAGPVLNPRDARDGSGPMLVLLDATWASAHDWAVRLARVSEALDGAAAADITVAIVAATDVPVGGFEFLAPNDWRARLAGFAPQPFAPDMDLLLDAVSASDVDFETLWLSDGVAREGREDVLRALQIKGSVTVFEHERPVIALGPADAGAEGVSIPVMRRLGADGQTATVIARGPDPSGVERILSRSDVSFAEGETQAVAQFELPSEVRNRVTRFEVEGHRSAAALRLADDSLKRRKVALVSVRESREGLELLSHLHYIRAALSDRADVISGELADLLVANPDVIVLADIARLSGSETADLLDWMAQGGVLLRFAGARLAASDVSRDDEDPLMPVRLRAGGRNIGGAMSWGEPKSLRSFADTSPFYGLSIPDDVSVSAQVMAQPDPELAARVIATLVDGTPLVTRKSVGAGQVVLFHVTANAEWSNLPLSGLFVDMLDRLTASSGGASLQTRDVAGQVLRAVRVLDGFGGLSDARNRAPVAGEVFVSAIPSALIAPGLYETSQATLALNVFASDTALAAQTWPAGTIMTQAETARDVVLKPLFLAGALMMLLIDVFASLWMSGRLLGPRAVAIGLLVLGALPMPRAHAQDANEVFALAATDEVALAYVMTGDSDLDAISRAGLFGVSQMLTQRTSVEPVDPVGVNLELDDLGFFPLIYWPISVDQPLPSAEAYTRLNAYLRTGGTILFDTRDGDVAGFGASTPTGLKLQRLAASLDIPPLEQIPADHVLTRTFYLLQDFPGRHTGRDLWVEAAPVDAEGVEGMPFRNLNDNVTPVIIGGNDWAAAWAMDETGRPLRPVARGFDGERQREIAYRFGVNLVMYVLTGNYKSDQVHVPALLDRLGQ